jgi:hypothetical protein
MMTPQRAHTRGKSFLIRGDSGSIAIGGRSVNIGGRMDGRRFMVALDANGDGQMQQQEWVLIGRDATAAFEIKAGDKTIPIVLQQVRGQRSRSGKLAYLRGVAVAASAMAGRVGAETIRLIDDNLDGLLTLNGEDAIAIGRSRLALPLSKMHKIGGAHYRLELSAQGESLTLEPAPDLALGVVELPRTMRNVPVVIVSDEGAYEVSEDGKRGIPAGDYRLSYGVLGRGAKVVVFRPPLDSKTKQPTADALVYPVQADMINALRIGAPVRVLFNAQYTENEIKVAPSFAFRGAGGERYDFELAGGFGKPKIALTEGDRQLHVGSMEYG